MGGLVFDGIRRGSYIKQDATFRRVYSNSYVVCMRSGVADTDGALGVRSGGRTPVVGRGTGTRLPPSTAPTRLRRQHPHRSSSADSAALESFLGCSQQQHRTAILADRPRSALAFTAAARSTCLDVANSPRRCYRPAGS